MTGELILSSNTYNEGREAINNAFSGSASFNTLSATTIYSGSTELSTLFNSLTISTFQTLLYGSTTYWGYNIGSNASVVLSGNTILEISGMTDGAYGTLLAKQDGSGGRTLTFGTGTHKVINGGGGSVILTSNANAEDILSFVYTSSVFYWNIGNNYS
jgi:hypothetical protein